MLFSGDNGNNNLVGTDLADEFVTGLGIDTVNGGAGEDILRMNYGSVAFDISYSYVGNGWYAFSDTFSNSVSFYNIERFHLTGGLGDDYLVGAGLADTLIGGSGHDTLDGSDGVDVISGGGGTDRWIVNYGSHTENVTVALSTSATPVVVSTGASVVGIEAITITTGTGNDVVNMGVFRGNDSINTGAGNDQAVVGLGYDSVNLGEGTDILRFNYSSVLSDISHNYVANGWWRYTTARNEASVEYYGADRFNLTGGAGDDVLTGAGLNDTLIGGAGDDTLTGGAGADSINGGEGFDRWVADFSSATTKVNAVLNSDPAVVVDVTTGVGTAVAKVSGIDALTITTGTAGDNLSTAGFALDDSFTTAEGADTIACGLGFDSVNAGAGDDLLKLDYSSLTGDITNNYVANGWYRYTDARHAASVDYYSVERFDLTGGTGDDWLGGGGLRDTLIGGGGDDTLNGSASNDVINGGDGIDQWVANFSAATGNVSVVLNTDPGVIVSYATGGAGLGTVQAVERLDITTGIGSDNLSTAGFACDDIFNTGDGNDIVSVGLGHDSVNAGAGNDLLRFDYSSLTGDIANSYVGNGWYRYADARNVASVDYYSVERVDLTGGAGDDWLGGGGFRDALVGGGGDDTLNGGAGNDLINGGDGVDLWVANFSASGGNVVVTLNADSGVAAAYSTGAATSGTVQAIERLDITTGSGADAISTGAFAFDDVMNTGLGDDAVTVGRGHDSVNLGEGTDLLRADYSAVLFDISHTYIGNGWWRYATARNEANVDYYSVERFDLRGGAGDDILNGAGLNDTLMGGNGDDTLTGGAGADSISGGNGIDRWGADFSGSSGAVNMVLSANPATVVNVATGVDATVAKVSAIECVSLTTGSGNDNVSTAALTGDDNVSTGLGDDTIALGRGHDTVNGGEGTDKLTLNYGFLTSDIDNVYLANGWYRYTDVLGTTSTDYYSIERFHVIGGAGDDALNGWNLSDTLIGGGGHDTINGGGGADSLAGGGGYDLFVFGSGSGADVIDDFVGGTGISDRLDIRAYGLGNFANVQTHLSQVGSDTLLTLSASDSVTLEGVSVGSLVADDFWIV